MIIHELKYKIDNKIEKGYIVSLDNYLHLTYGLSNWLCAKERRRMLVCNNSPLLMS